MANNRAIMKHMQNEFQFGLVRVLTKATLGHPRFYNFSIGITFLPYKSTLLSLCGPPDLSAFLHSCIYILNTNIAHIIPISSQYVTGSAKIDHVSAKKSPIFSVFAVS